MICDACDGMARVRGRRCAECDGAGEICEECFEPPGYCECSDDPRGA